MTLLATIKALIGIQPDPLAEKREILRRHITRLAEIETRNRITAAVHRLEQLEAQGEPIPRQPAQPIPPVNSRPALRPVYCYETDNATGYPYRQAVRYEQDPLFGWPIDVMADFGLDLSTAFPVNSFPREMFPDRPSSLRHQIAQDAVRFQSRLWFEQCPQYAGVIGHLINYCVGTGMTVDVVALESEEEDVERQEQGEAETETPGAVPDADEEPENPNDALAEEIQEYLDGFAKFQQNRLKRRVRQSFLNFFRDGEDALRLFPGAEFPAVRSVDTSTIRGPHNEIYGPWSFGVLTSWPLDWEDVQAYHLWHSDNTHEDVSPIELHLAKLDTTGANVKRGVPLAYKARHLLPQMTRLLTCMAVGEAARQAIPYVQQYQLADKAAVRAATPSALEAYDAMRADQLHGLSHAGDEIEPGGVQHISKGLEFIPPPTGSGQSGVLVYRNLCEALAAAFNVPLWFTTSTADQETEASAIVAESPVGLLITNYQGIVGDHYRETLEAVVDMSGRFPANWRDKAEIHCELPSLPSRDEQEAVNADLSMLDKKLLSPQHFCTRHKLDFDEETDLIAQAEAQGWESQPQQPMNPDGELTPFPETGDVE